MHRSNKKTTPFPDKIIRTVLRVTAPAARCAAGRRTGGTAAAREGVPETYPFGL